MPFCPAVAVKDNVVEMAPVMSVKEPPLVFTCHCTVGVGLPVAAAVNVACDPEVTVAFDGSWVTEGDVVSSMNSAVTDLSALASDTVQVPVPEHPPPDQPENT